MTNKCLHRKIKISCEGVGENFHLRTFPAIQQVHDNFGVVGQGSLHLFPFTANAGKHYWY